MFKEEKKNCKSILSIHVKRNKQQIKPEKEEEVIRIKEEINKSTLDLRFRRDQPDARELRDPVTRFSPYALRKNSKVR